MSQEENPIRVPEVKIRKCLKCNKEFKSIGLRICPYCTKNNQALSKWEISSLAVNESKKDLNIID